jgi:hypothetical protein
MVSQSVATAITTEGFGNSNLTFKKKVQIVEKTYEGEVCQTHYITDIYYFWGQIKKGSKTYAGPWKIEYTRSAHSDKLQDSYGNTNCDYLLHRNFGIIDVKKMPIFMESCSAFDADVTIDTPIADYLVPATPRELFFAKSCEVTNAEKQTISWEFGENDFYHQ